MSVRSQTKSAERVAASWVWLCALGLFAYAHFRVGRVREAAVASATATDSAAPERVCATERTP
jgi:hypothetical protein